MEELSLSLYSSHKTSSLFAAGFADSGIFYNGLQYEVAYIQNKPASNALTVPSLSLRTTYSAPQLTARSIRPFTLIITNYFLCTFSRFPSFFFAHVLPYVKSYKHKHSLPSIYLVFYVRILHISCLDPVQNIHLSVGHRGRRGPFSPQKNVFLATHTWVHTDTIL